MTGPTTAQMEGIQASLDLSGRNRVKTEQYAKRAKNHVEGITDWTGDHAIFLADMCVEWDIDYDMGGALCLEWMLDNYIGMEFERRAQPLISDILLVLKKYSERKKFYYFNDMEAFLVPHDEKDVFVFGKEWREEPRYLCISESNSIFHRFYVRKIWRKTKLNCIGGIDQPTLSEYKKHDFKLGYENGLFYGDARDQGHIMTYEKMIWTTRGEQPGKCDKVLWGLPEALHWLFLLGSLHNALRGEQNEV